MYTMLNLILRSKAEIKVLGVVLFKNNLHLREIARQATISPFEARREVLILEKATLLTTTKRGNQTIVSINRNCLFLNEIKSLYLKTEGLFSQINQSLTKIKNIKFAFIYGSMASNKDNEKSDLDLLIIGNPNEIQLEKEIFKIQRKTPLEINYNVWSESDIKKKAGSFLSQILKEKKVFLIGSESEFSRIAKKSSNTKNPKR